MLDLERHFPFLLENVVVERDELHHTSNLVKFSNRNFWHCHIVLIMKFLDTFVFPLLLFRDLDGFVLVKSPKVLANVMVSSTYLAY